MKPGPKKKEAARKRRLKTLVNMDEEVREHALKTYFHYCKEKAAKNFINWRMEQAKIVKIPELRAALRYRRLGNFKKYDKEEDMFRLYLKHEDDFEAV